MYQGYNSYFLYNCQPLKWVAKLSFYRGPCGTHFVTNYNNFAFSPNKKGTWAFMGYIFGPNMSWPNNRYDTWLVYKAR